jgi:hypothetical protein
VSAAFIRITFTDGGTEDLPPEVKLSSDPNDGRLLLATRSLPATSWQRSDAVYVMDTIRKWQVIRPGPIQNDSA